MSHRYPTAKEVEDVFAVLGPTPRGVGIISTDAEVPYKRTKYALDALRFQRRAVRIRHRRRGQTTYTWRLPR